MMPRRRGGGGGEGRTEWAGAEIAAEVTFEMETLHLLVSLALLVSWLLALLVSGSLGLSVSRSLGHPTAESSRARPTRRWGGAAAVPLAR